MKTKFIITNTSNLKDEYKKRKATDQNNDNTFLEPKRPMPKKHINYFKDGTQPNCYRHAYITNYIKSLLINKNCDVEIYSKL